MENSLRLRPCPKNWLYSKVHGQPRLGWKHPFFASELVEVGKRPVWHGDLQDSAITLGTGSGPAGRSVLAD